jgi:hypothetical protein
LKSFDYKLPKIFAEFSVMNGAIVISDPDLAADLYTTQNKYLDKPAKFRTVVKQVLGTAMGVAPNS